MTRLGIARDQCYRDSMEDRAVAGPVAGGLVVGVFDGHGGAAVAEHAEAHVLEAVETALARGLHDAALWRSVFERLDLAADACGSTATILLVRDGDLSAAWVGDSPAVLVTADDHEVLTPEHRLCRRDEYQRVVQAGAVIVPPYAMDPTTQHGLMVTRALGDRALRRIGIIAEPEVATVALLPEHLGFVAATDGLWDVVSHDTAAAVCRSEEPEAAAARLFALVVDRRGTDNVTVVVGRFERYRGPG